MAAAPSRLLVAISCLLAVGGCRSDDLAFRNDVPVTIESPAHRAHVKLPIRVQLTTTKNLVQRQSRAPDLALFAVFVDQEPMPVGQTLAWVARDDDGCRSSPGCPDLAYLHERAIYVTSSTSVDIDTVLSSPRGRDLSEGLHQMTVVLLDADGRRQGEPVASRQFFVTAVKR